MTIDAWDLLAIAGMILFVGALWWAFSWAGLSMGVGLAAMAIGLLGAYNTGNGR